MSQFEPRSFTSSDGTKIRYYVAGDPGAPPMVLCGGFGAYVGAWKYFLKEYAPRYRIVTWDYRGLLESGPAPDLHSYTVQHQLQDLLDLMDHEQIPDAIVVGWSMGVQLCLELQRAHAHRVRAFVLLNGAAGAVVRKALGIPQLSELLDEACRRVAHAEERFGQGSVKVADHPTALTRFGKVLRLTGFLGKDIDLELFAEILRRWLKNDFRLYAAMFRSVDRHDVTELLGEISVPVLVIAGDRDFATPEKLARTMASQIPRARLKVFPGTSHFALLEHPAGLIREMNTFLAGLVK